jgi:hypothetical protein
MARPVSLPRDSGAAWLARAALLIVIAALLLAAPRSARLVSPPPGGTLLEVQAYDLDTAFNLAGEQVPLLVQEYYFFALIGEAAPAREAAELAQKLRQAAREHDYLGISGPDPARNRRALLAALQQLRGQPLDGLVLIYLGPVEQEAEIVETLRDRGIEPRFVAYPPQGVLL